MGHFSWNLQIWKAQIFTTKWVLAANEGSNTFRKTSRARLSRRLMPESIWLIVLTQQHRVNLALWQQRCTVRCAAMLRGVFKGHKCMYSRFNRVKRVLKWLGKPEKPIRWCPTWFYDLWKSTSTSARAQECISCIDILLFREIISYP